MIILATIIQDKYINAIAIEKKDNQIHLFFGLWITRRGWREKINILSNEKIMCNYLVFIIFFE